MSLHQATCLCVARISSRIDRDTLVTAETEGHTATSERRHATRLLSPATRHRRHKAPVKSLVRRTPDQQTMSSIAVGLKKGVSRAARVSCVGCVHHGARHQTGAVGWSRRRRHAQWTGGHAGTTGKSVCAGRVLLVVPRVAATLMPPRRCTEESAAFFIGAAADCFCERARGRTEFALLSIPRPIVRQRSRGAGAANRR